MVGDCESRGNRLTQVYVENGRQNSVSVDTFPLASPLGREGKGSLFKLFKIRIGDVQRLVRTEKCIKSTFSTKVRLDRN